MTLKIKKNASLILKPKVLYPYHYGETNTDELVKLLKSHKEIEVRIRKMK